MPTVAINFLLIVVARITDVSLDTIRTVAIIQGRRAFAAVLGFFEAVIYICVVAKVLLNMNRPAYALAYGVGFACGTYLGIRIEEYLAFGDQVILLFTKKGLTLSKALLDAGYRIAKVEAHVREGDLTIVFVEVARRNARSLLRQVSSLDPSCFSVINDVRMAKFIGPAMPNAGADSPGGASHPLVSAIFE